VRICWQTFTLKEAIGSHAGSLETLVYVCEQWHYSRVFTPLTDWPCKSRPNTEGIASGEHGARNTEKEPAQTNFPFPITTGMSFNRSLWQNTGAQIGRESRAFMNEGNAFSTFWAPVINLAREPRWGRNIECTVPVFGRNFHSRMPLGCSLLLPVGTVNSIQTLKVPVKIHI
jgi:hypothetical protein